MDPFAGSGGNVIQFSKNCKSVIAVDIDPNKIEICRHNCEVYRCPDNIKIIESDFLKLELETKVIDNIMIIIGRLCFSFSAMGWTKL